MARRSWGLASTVSEGHREHVDLRLALGIGQLDEQDVSHRCVTWHGNNLDDLGGLDQPGLAPEPALPLEVAGKDGLQLGLVPTSQRVLPCAPYGERGQCASRG